jgi:hypothetical protein
VWTPQKFVESFLSEKPTTDATIIVSAGTAGVSERKARLLLDAAIEARLAHPWTFGNRKKPHKFATREQSVTETGGGS